MLNKKRVPKRSNISERLAKQTEVRNTSWYRHHWVDIVFALIICLLLAFMFPRGKSYQFADLKEGAVYVGEEIIAPFTFSVNKSEEEYSKDIQQARQSVAPVFSFNENIGETQLEKLHSFTEQATILLKNATTSSSDLESFFNNAGIVVSDQDLRLLLNGFKESSQVGNDRNVSDRVQAFEKVMDICIPLVKERFTTGIINRAKEELAPSRSKISVQRKGQETVEELRYYNDISEASNILLETLRETGALNEREVKIAYLIGSHFLKPNLIYDRQETEARIQDGVSNVPLAKDQVLAGERIIDSHQRLTKQHIEKLTSLAVAKAERGEMQGFWEKAKPNLGKFLLVAAILAILVFFLWKDQRDVLLDLKKRSLIAISIVFAAVFIYLSTRFTLSPYIVPVATSAIIVTVFFNVKVGFWVSLALSLLIGGMRGNEYSISFVSMFVCSVAVLSVSRVRNRNWVIRSGLLISAAYILSITVIDFIGYADFAEITKNWGFGVLNGFLAPGLAYILVIILEAAFDMTTDMTLLELSDFNHPLLRRLSLEAPGTYHHSYLIGMLAESAAETLGGNALLARVGAYYHDIGKLEKPEYFVENQSKGRNPQEKLAPRMSSLILSNHVRRGIEMAREYGLPKEVEAFIPEHHGTALMNFFYQKALEKNDQNEVSQSEFRYPGPKPQTKETAIVMLADAVEAASRTLKDPKPSRIKNRVEQIIDERFKSGELDEAPLTLKDLSKISNAFQKILIGIFHGRIEYPGQEAEEQEQKDVTPEEQLATKEDE